VAGVTRGGTIIGWGAALPDRVRTNADLEAHLATTDAWIRERTGIRERRVGSSTTDLAVDAGRAALARAGVDPASVGMVLVATCSPDQALPATAAHVQRALGTGGGALDVNGACAGFVYALVCAFGLVATGVERILVIGAETMTRLVDDTDRTTAILFGDGGGAVVVEAVDGPGALLGTDLGCDGSGAHLLACEVGGTMVMDGREVFRRAVRATVRSAGAALDRAGLRPDDVDVLVPHQANARILDAACERLGIASARAVSTLEHSGNTSAASIPLTLCHAAATGRLHPGDRVLFVGFGAGMSWASAVVRWDAPAAAAMHAGDPWATMSAGIPSSDEDRTGGDT
jgi:3-oxoacyl-[acyl-carrier-protein] synthase-3